MLYVGKCFQKMPLENAIGKSSWEMSSGNAQRKCFWKAVLVNVIGKYPWEMPLRKILGACP